MAKGEDQLTTKVELGSPYQLDKNQVRLLQIFYNAPHSLLHVDLPCSPRPIEAC
jgi:hypothetical protein